MEMGGKFSQILELGGTTIKGQRVASQKEPSNAKDLYVYTNNINCYVFIPVNNNYKSQY